MHVLALTLALLIPTDNPGAWTLSVSPQVAVPVQVGMVHGAITLPFVTLYRPFASGYSGGLEPYRDALFAHEVQHYRQERALGPWFLVGYAATLGQPFEPDTNGWSDAWLPPPTMEGDYPFLRVSGSGVEFMPGYLPHEASDTRYDPLRAGQNLVVREAHNVEPMFAHHSVPPGILGAASDVVATINLDHQASGWAVEVCDPPQDHNLTPEPGPKLLAANALPQ